MPDKPKRPATSGTRHGNGAGKGDGYGGPARAPGDKQNLRTPFEPGNQVTHVRRGPEAAQALKDHLFALATTAERQETQVTAAVAWLNRHEGTPIARNINLTPDDVTVLDDGTLTAIALGKGAETTH